MNFDLKDEYDLGLTERKCIQKEKHRPIELAGAVERWSTHPCLSPVPSTVGVWQSECKKLCRMEPLSVM